MTTICIRQQLELTRLHYLSMLSLQSCLRAAGAVLAASLDANPLCLHRDLANAA
jgi:hypothetical protein